MQILAATEPRATRTRDGAWSTRLLFLIVGIGTAAWAPLVPHVKAQAGLSEAQLGLLLLCLGIGSIAAMPLAGAAAARFGLRPVVLFGTGAIALPLPILANADSAWLIAPCLLLFGAGMGAVDCAMNLQAVAVEKARGRPMMSGFHGLYSLGSLVGALAAGALLFAGLGIGTTTLLAVAAIAVMFAASWPGILARAATADGPAFALPRGIVLAIGILCCITFLTEGSVLDWSAVFLSQDRGVDAARATLGYAAFSVTMTAGRLAGDLIVARLGRRRVLVLGGLCAAAGLALTVLVPAWEAALAGYALVGAGCANIVPVLFTAAGRQTAMPPSVAVPAVTTFGYAGVLAGPALIGFLAQATSLPTAFLAVAVLLVGVAGAGRVLRL
ncbi:MFS transporter [Methylobacterium sp. J-067]|uniref:MFS transporter n=1 Tax=Methylobacterium sp. J-067 TaxID=2836648 RepID=UPI001FB8B859|nr:MFS transporter [Methylobacterium sp. J-067]MCJ2022665.1 MFS transporter [Methylobacterium sp. J-067]